ncbi:MerR HTH family regulatory protein [Mycolicibacterium neoaurum]|uniref:MerR family transcriptional regulator n=1 Tax=Mycolicibacterium neoaurum TaxID=1795 RepID=UPI00087FF838|nr:MerR HTH family regulatory protein [Mycolicibacterium neoaurum]
MALTEYRLHDLARASGVSARNIRAYRERGLLDPPRRVGRAAFYDAVHLVQLQTINRLLARGFTSAHIAEFFEAARAGRDLRDALGLDAAILRPRQPADGVHLDPREYADASATISETIGDCADSLASEAVSAWHLATPGVVGAEDLIGLVTGRVERLMRERLSEAASTASGCEPKLTDQ